MIGVLCLILSLGVVSDLGAVTVGLVDMQRVILAVDKGKELRGKLETFYKSKQVELKKEEDEFKKLQKDYEKQKLVLNESARLAKEKELRADLMQLQELSLKYQKELQGMEQKLKRPLIDEIRKVVEKISVKNNVDITFETGMAPVIYIKSKVDLTEKTVAAFNKANPVKKTK